MDKINIIANWKMNLNIKKSSFLAHQVVKSFHKNKNFDLIICPSYPSLAKVAEIIHSTGVKLGAQNVFYQDLGAYTGEVSPSMLKEFGCQYVIVGHSERRKYQNETDDDVNKKVKAVLSCGMTPIVCIGEDMEQKKEGKTDLVVIQQLDKALAGVKLTNGQNIIIAYEPVWAISPSRPDDPGQVQHIAHIIRHIFMDLYSLEETEKRFSVIYGGSVDVNNIDNYIVPGLVSGVLVGGASQQARTFLPLIKKIFITKI